MSLLPFGELVPYRTRQFIPSEIDFEDWGALETIFDRLERQAADCKSAAEFEAWLLAVSEFYASVDEESARRYIAMTCHTDDSEAERAYLRFVERIEPELKPRQFKLSKIYLEHGLRKELPRDRYLVFDRDTEVEVALFRDENVALETEEAKVSQQYQKLSGSLTVEFEGREQTLVQMGRYQEETDRDLRQRAWELSARRRLQEADTFDDQFDQLLELRGKIATNAGFENYRDFSFRRLGRFDYGPEECLKFHEAIEQEVMPLQRELQQRRKSLLGVETLRPWDGAVDPKNRAPLKPFDDVAAMISRTQSVFNDLDDGLARDFDLMRESKVLDLENRKGKAPGGYQCTLSEARLPFIFMNAIGVQRDVETLLHEAGHAFHALAAREEDFYPYRNAPIEFCEVASMSMELLASPFLGAFYERQDFDRARRKHLEGIVDVFPWIATVDAFQHWLYANPSHTRDDRRQAWLDLMDRFGGDIDWSGQEEIRSQLWHRQLHIFIHPFYYIEYGIAQLGALQVWLNSMKDSGKALADYKAGLALGGARPLPELFQAAGCQFDFSADAVRPLVGALRAELTKLEEA